MMKKEITIQCNNDSMLALAELDGIPLCENCLLGASSSCDKSCLQNRITPLNVQKRILEQTKEQSPHLFE